MKYTVTINQVGIADAGLWDKTDIVDWALMDYVKDWIFSGAAVWKAIGASPAIWINLATVLTEMPCIGIKTKGALTRRIRKLESLGLLVCAVSKEKLFVYPTDQAAAIMSFRAKPLPQGNGTVADGQRTVAVGQRQPPDHHRTSKQDQRDIPYKRIIDYLNDHCGTNYRATIDKTRKLIEARFNEGFTAPDFEYVVDVKSAEWLGDPKWEHFLRPSTLFGNKFESYRNQKKAPVTVRDERKFTREEAAEYREANGLPPEAFERRVQGGVEYYILKKRGANPAAGHGG